MRILRGKSSLEVSSQGFAVFVAGLVLATFLGGAVRTILRSERVHARIVSELKNRFPRNEFQIGRTEVLLSRGLWPGLGLRLSDVVFKQDVCGKLSFELNVPQAVLPVDLLSLRHGRARLGHVQIDDARMHLDYRDCPPKPSESYSPPVQGIRSAVAEKGIKPPPMNWEELSRHIESLELSHFALTYERNITWKVIFKSAEIDFSDEMDLQAVVEIQKNLTTGGLLSHEVELEAHGEKNELNWSVKSEFKEGHLRWGGTWDLDANSAQTKVNLVQIPLKDLSSELFQMGFAPQEVKLKTAWLTCQAAWEGAVEQFGATPVQVRNCKLEGAYGRVEMEAADVYIQEDPPLRAPAELQVQKLQVQPLIESLGRQLLPTVLSRTGVWSGLVSFKGTKFWDMNGLLENIEVVFSNQSVRGKQLIRSVRTQATRTGEAIEGSVTEVKLQDGDFAGRIGFQLQGDGRTGGFHVDIERLGFSSAIQNILVGGQMGALRINGNGGLVEGELKQWQGSLSVNDVRGEGWRGEGLEVKSRFVPGVFHLEAHVNRVEGDTRWKLYPQLRAVRANLPDSVIWKDIVAKVEIQKEGGTVTSLSAIEAERGVPWRARGTWVRDGALNATLLVGGTGHQQAFALRGERGALFIHDKQLGDSP